MRVVSNSTDSNVVQLADWMMPPSIWLRMPSGLTASPLPPRATARTTRASPVAACPSTPSAARAAREAGVALHYELERDGGVAGEVFVAREGEAAAAAPGALEFLPAEF